jgi:hypothetical protein
MGEYTSTPDFDAWLGSAWGVPYESFGSLPLWSGASNVVLGTNPPYTIQDFLSFYPKWGGSPLLEEATLTVGSNQIQVGDVTGIAVGNPVADQQTGLIPNGTLVSGVDSVNNILTLSAPPTQSGQIVLTVWNQPLIPFVVILAYIYVATSCLIQARWQELWLTAMGLMIAHFCTLYAQSDGNPNSTLGQAAAAGMSTGVTTAKSAGDVSISFQPFEAISGFAMFNSTSFGQQLATFAKAIGSGGMLLY